MTDSIRTTNAPPADARVAALVDELRTAISGEVHADALHRAMYATDASIYEIVPDAVVLPRTVADVSATVRAGARHGLPVTPRGAGTGLTGGAVNRGIQLDVSRYLNRIIQIDPPARTARVQPGVVLDELNAALRPHGLHFAPDVATGNRATIGGMIANNSCGTHSILVGRTCDHVRGLETVLSDGSTYVWGRGAPAQDNPLAARCEETIAAVAREYADEVAARYPHVMRRNGGYALDRLRLGNGRLNSETILAGSEGTLGVIVEATLQLMPFPRYKGMVVVHFDALLPALGAVPAMLEHRPAAVELLDKLILDAALKNPAMARRRWFIEGDPAAIQIVEFYEEDEASLHRRLNDLVQDLRKRSLGYAWPLITETARQADVWELRKAGTGLLMSRPGDAKPHDFVDDAAVDPAKLRDYIERVGHILEEEGAEGAGYYAHASVGCLHVRPVVNLKTREGVGQLRRIAERVSSLALDCGGTFTGEHGDGIVRSEFLAKMYGPKIIEAFRKLKTAFDPQNLFNPNKIVDPLPMDGTLRHGVDFQSQDPRTILDFSAFGGMAGLVDMCMGLGQCRQRLVGTMCPSYMATADEQHSTRARANALRIALSNRPLLTGLADPALDEVFDLCLSCKACKTECPTGTDVAKLKAEWLAARHRRLGVPRRSRLIARSVDLAPLGSRFAPLSNWVMQSMAVRVLMEHWYGLDRRMPPPRFARQTFRKWFAHHVRQRSADETPHRPPVVYFVDTWVNHYTPSVGIATVRVLEALGYNVLVPPTVCCGRPLISKGMLAEARLLAEDNVEILTPYADRGIPIVGTEPSCVSVLVDELPQFVRTPEARRIAELARTVEAFVAGELARNPAALTFREGRRPLLYHGHCHQKSLFGTAEAMQVLTACTGGGAAEINSGCCGMAGSFGHEVEHYEVAAAVGEQRLFPAVRQRGEAVVAVSGFSCRHQIEHHTHSGPRHVMEILADSLA